MSALALALVSAALAGDPCPIPVRFAAAAPAWRDADADLAALQTQRRWFGLTYRERGGAVVVVAAAPGSPAAAAGLSPGDAITAAGGAPVASTAAIDAAFDGTAEAGAIALTVSQGGASREVTLTRGRADPLLLGLVQHTRTQACRDTGLAALTHSQVAAVGRAVVDGGRAFRCDDAHAALNDAGLEAGTVVLVRGGQRVLLALPGWATRCVTVAETDGAALTDARLAALLDALTAAYVADRHANP